MKRFLIILNNQIADAADHEQEALDAAEELRLMHKDSEVNIYTLSSTFFAHG